MRLVAWLIGLPLAVVATVFAVANRQEIHFDLWPLPFGLDVAAYLAVLAPLALGLATGAALVWVSGAGARLRARAERRRADSLERRLADRQSPTP
ncbi:MAG: LapA family protein [Phaeospirillum sp.]|nr:LapA family protein [Phaeospirillum sp.]